MIKVRKILVLVDFSKSSEQAVHYGIEIGRDRNARVYFLHMLSRRMVDAVHNLSGKGYKGDFLQALKKLANDREQDLKRFVPEELREGLDAEFLIRKGESDEEIIKVAKELSIDLIVVGSHGHATPAPTPLESVIQALVSHAPCPVLVVRPIEHDFIE